MNKSTITKLNNQFDIVIGTPTVEYFSGISYRMAFDAYTDGNNTIYVMVKTKETISQAIERAIERKTEIRLRRIAATARELE
jgi:hypothetical protein